ncbi:hypothetical protein GE21DRAFT_9821 [Neurospora crassa]|uniref:Ecp2 effector protein domain-containing protein n=1 Tax=Neurospora crassa (strain ATCC 24698 / 74-OR23-1A / CBS 708.71 / DSM 1257 / FGSC 987) TaxID=367110 RepID=Q7S3E2_NEUCR|nr:hypothetical protein NCU06911 [Neurospora crassa OR74A]EAA30022.1 hypothetical protein NCU06911 [Neurospora crassa OR74A]KHE82590.1 hypothetical protein GE21DRAFT_9821 [Neurospora crassa]|eukprot:XP_959258.1 hypothetical protein NCU06911 [Neurospora crassa OR74A]
MVAMKLATIVVLATVAVAAPTTAVTTTDEAKPFSFSQWVADIMNPDVVALTPEQAVEAYYQSINATASTHDGAVKAKRFNRICWTDPNSTERRAKVDDAIKCVNSLAALGSTHYNIDYEQSIELCRDTPGARLVVGPGYPAGGAEATADKLAVAAGKIMDGCTWGGTTGGNIFEEWSPWLCITLERK